MNRRIRLLVLGLALILAPIIAVTSVFAALELQKRSTKTRGKTTITWDSSLADFNYTCNGDINMTVNWTVEDGAASYMGFKLKRFTPRSKKDPATGTTPGITYPGSNGANSVDVSFSFTGLHQDKRRKVDIGNAHFKMYLNIDKNGDGVLDSVAGYGVNVHVEDPKPYGCP